MTVRRATCWRRSEWRAVSVQCLLLALAFSATSVAAASDEAYSLWKVDDFKACPGVAASADPSSAREHLSLDGPWQVKLDPESRGFGERWFDVPAAGFDTAVTVPGNWNAQGLGGEGVPRDEGVPLPAAPTPGVRSAAIRGSYVGVVWYRRSVEIPRTWRDRQVRLVFSGVLYSVRLWINGEFVGGRWTDGNAFYIDVSGHLRPGESNTIVMACDNRWKQSATISHLQWYTVAGGPFHHLGLCALPRVRLERAIVRPQLGADDTGVAEVHANVTNESNNPVKIRVEAEVSEADGEPARPVAVETVSLPTGASKEVVVPVAMKHVVKWTWDNPYLYTLTVRLFGQDASDCVRERFGMRTADVQGNRFRLNGRPVFLRGQHFNFFWPDTLSPPITKEAYLEYMKPVKEYGFNFLRTPWLMPEECYQAADELGMMLQLEFPYTFGEYAKIKEPLLKRLIAECLTTYGNHPSLAVLCMSNEGSWDGRGSLNPALCAYAKSLDPSRVVMDTDGKPETMDAVLQGEIASLSNEAQVWSDYMKAAARQSEVYSVRPCIDHEFLNVPTLFDLAEIHGFRGALCSAPAESSARVERVRRMGLENDFPQYLRASCQQQADFIKEGMERSRKNPLKAGFSMCAWSDIPATTQWGIVDQFLKPKAITAEQMRPYNSESVVLMDFVDKTQQPQIVPDYCRRCDEPLVIQPYVSHFGDAPIVLAALRWSVDASSGNRLAEGATDVPAIAPYTVALLPRISIDLPGCSSPQEATLRLLLDGKALSLQNSWPVWLFPKATKRTLGRPIYATEKVFPALERLADRVLPAENQSTQSVPAEAIWVTDEADRAHGFLQAGKAVLFLAPSKAVPNPYEPGWFVGDAHMGSLIWSSALLGDFPHRGLASWQFRNLIGRTGKAHDPTIAARRAITSIFNDSQPHVRHQLFSCRTERNGHLTYCLLRVLSGCCEGDYLLQELLTNVRRDETNPLMPAEQLDRILGISSAVPATGKQDAVSQLPSPARGRGAGGEGG